jgi:hypothetical protein
MRSLCDNGKLFDSKFKNALDMTAYGDIEGCRDMSHLCGMSLQPSLGTSIT